MSATARIKSLFSRPRTIVNSVLLAGFAAMLLREVLFWLPKDVSGTSLNYWAYTDWLIDYSQGFIRRGLSGGSGTWCRIRSRRWPSWGSFPGS